LEDVLTTGQRPKVDEYEDQLFVLLQMVYEDEAEEMVFGAAEFNGWKRICNHYSGVAWPRRI
jgi:Mg2+ and Co2+ transporter CorA